MKKAAFLFCLLLRLQGLSAAEASPDLFRDILLPGRALLGSPYRLGGTGPAGFDCSGLITYLYKRYVPRLPRTSRRMAAFGSPVPREGLRPGDLVFFATGGTPGQVTHVALFLGGNSLLHAISNGPETGVVLSDLSARYWDSCYAGAARVLDFPDPAPSAPARKVENLPYAEGIYSGEIRQGQPAGQGSLRTPEGERYSGEFREGRLLGAGGEKIARSRESSPWNSWDGVVDGDFRLWLQEEQNAFEEWKKTH